MVNVKDDVLFGSAPAVAAAKTVAGENSKALRGPADGFAGDPTFGLSGGDLDPPLAGTPPRYAAFGGAVNLIHRPRELSATPGAVVGVEGGLLGITDPVLVGASWRWLIADGETITRSVLLPPKDGPTTAAFTFHAPIVTQSNGPYNAYMKTYMQAYRRK